MDNEEKNKLNQVIANLTEENSKLRVALDEKNSERKNSLVELEGFMHKAAHDIKNPLFATTGFSTLLLESAVERLTPVEKEYLELIIQGGTDISIIIKDIISYVNAVVEDVNNEEVDVNEVVESIFASFGGQAAKKGILLRKLSSFPQIKTDKEKLYTCLQQIVSNAIKFYDPNKSDIYIYFSCEEVNDEYQIKISDNGVGIVESDKNIFAPFSYLNMQKEYKGTGMGLAICNVLVGKLGGKVSYESIQGEGSTFYIFLNKD